MLGLGIGIPFGRSSFDIASMFASGEQGQVLDRSNLASMYQESTGVTPVYQPGQGQVDPPVGLALDVKHGLARGEERATQSTISGLPAGGGTRIYSTGASLVAGKSYEITATVTDYAGTSAVGFSTSSGVISSTQNISGNGVIQAIRLATGSGVLNLYTQDLNTCNFSNISIRALPGNHEIQATAASRPKLSGRVNLLSRTEDLSHTDWTKDAVTVAAATAPDGTSTAWRVVPDAASSNHRIRNSPSTTGSRSESWVVKADGMPIVKLRNGSNYVNFNVTTGTVLTVSNYTSASVTSLGDGWYYLKANGATAAEGLSYIYPSYVETASLDNTAFPGNGVDGVLVWHPQSEPSSTATRYQRVVDANTYDTSGFPLFIDWDGVDDGMATATTVDFTGTDKMFVAAGVTKLSDAAQGTVVELSTSYSGNPGAFLLDAPDGAASNFGFALRGTANSYYVEPGFPAPTSKVLAASFNITAATNAGAVIPRMNGVVSQTGASGAAPAGTAFGNHTLYTGRRAGASLPFRGRDYARVILGRKATAREIFFTEQWIGSRMQGLVTLPTAAPTTSFPDVMFTLGEQGQVIDRSNLSSMYQDSAGTTAVYQPGQGQVDPPVGLALDVKHGLARGAEVIPQPVDFSTWWTLAGATLNSSQSFTTAAAGGVQSGSSLSAGKTYEIILSGTFGATTNIFISTNLAAISAGVQTNYRVILTPTVTAVLYLRHASAGTSTVTALSVREIPGNHEIQATAASRPKLSGRVNLLASTENYASASWTKVGAGTATAPVPTDNYLGETGTTRIVFDRGASNTLSDQSTVAQVVSGAVAGQSYYGNFEVKATTPSEVGKVIMSRGAGSSSYRTIALTTEWQMFGGVETAGSTTVTLDLGLRGGLGVATQSADVLVRRAQHVSGSQLILPYQRVTDANTYDTAGFPLFLEWDAVDDGMATAATVDFSATDKMFVAAGLTTLSSGGTVGMYTELTTDANILGGFYVSSPGSPAGTYRLNLGAPAASFLTSAAYPAPRSDVLVAQYDKAGTTTLTSISLRLRGVAVSGTSAVEGDPAGNFVNATLYTGRRAGTTLPYQGRDYARVILGRTATATEIAQTEQWLAEKMKGLVTLP